MKKLSIYLCIILFLCSCKKENAVTAASADPEITSVLERFYKTYGASSEALYNRPITENLFTPEIKRALENIVNASRQSMEAVKKSSHPDEKPMVLEGSLFTSLYEGYTHYTIKSIQVRNLQPHVKVADATVAFENASVSPKITWTENVHLVDFPGSEWRIDNITFDKIAQVKDLKTRLNELRAEFK